MATSFPIVLANGPPPAGLQEVPESGVTMLRTGIAARGRRGRLELDVLARSVAATRPPALVCVGRTRPARPRCAIEGRREHEGRRARHPADGEFLYVIAVRRGGATSQVRFTGLPTSLRGGQVLFEYVQDPLPPPIGAGSQIFRSVAVTAGAFRDWLAPHDTRVSRFAL